MLPTNSVSIEADSFGVCVCGCEIMRSMKMCRFIWCNAFVECYFYSVLFATMRVHVVVVPRVVVIAMEPEKNDGNHGCL